MGRSERLDKVRSCAPASIPACLSRTLGHRVPRFGSVPAAASATSSSQGQQDAQLVRATPVLEGVGPRIPPAPSPQMRTAHAPVLRQLYCCCCCPATTPQPFFRGRTANGVCALANRAGQRACTAPQAHCCAPPPPAFDTSPPRSHNATQTMGVRRDARRGPLCAGQGPRHVGRHPFAWGLTLRVPCSRAGRRRRTRVSRRAVEGGAGGMRAGRSGGGGAGGRVSEVGNAGLAGIGAGCGMPCGAAAITEATTVPWASQSDSPSPPVM